MRRGIHSRTRYFLAKIPRPRDNILMRDRGIRRGESRAFDNIIKSTVDNAYDKAARSVSPDDHNLRVTL